jgi:hypothetical protein
MSRQERAQKGQGRLDIIRRLPPLARGPINVIDDLSSGSENQDSNDNVMLANTSW